MEDQPSRLLHVVLRGSTYGGISAASRLFSRALKDRALQGGLRYQSVEVGGSSTLQKLRSGARLLLAQRADPRCLLFFDHVGPARVQAVLSASWRRSYAVFLHGIEVWRAPRPTAARALVCANILLSNSDYTRRRASESWPALPKVSVVPLGLVEETPQGVPDRTLLCRLRPFFFVLVGRMDSRERYKGHDLVLDAFAALLRRGRQMQCVVVGEGDDRLRLEERALSLGLGGSVLFTGTVSGATLEALYSRSRALVLPSTGEGFGLVYLEAMRLGRPCVAASGGAAQEVVIHDKTGLLVEAGNVAALESALLQLAEDTGRAESYGEAGRRRWAASYTEARFRERFNRELNRALFGSD